VGKAPARVSVAAGGVAVASLELMKLPLVFQSPEPAAQTPPPAGPQTAGNITFEPVGCMVAGQFPLIDATIEPAASVARARVYFKSALGPAFYYVEMTQAAAGTAELRGPALASTSLNSTLAAAMQPPAGTRKFVGKLPKPKLEASPITYYIMAIMTDGTESQTAEVQAQVVADESECPEGLRVAPIGGPGAVTVFSVTGAVAKAVGFTAAGGALGLTAILVGLGLLGIGGAIRELDNPTTTLVVVTTTTSTTTTTTTTTTSTTLPACVFGPLPNCAPDPVTGAPRNCPCQPIGTGTCATRVSGQPCPAGFPDDRVTECCAGPVSCADIGAPTQPSPINSPCK
jgi:hypothetical protein